MPRTRDCPVSGKGEGRREIQDRDREEGPEGCGRLKAPTEFISRRELGHVVSGLLNDVNDVTTPMGKLGQRHRGRVAYVHEEHKERERRKRDPPGGRGGNEGPNDGGLMRLAGVARREKRRAFRPCIEMSAPRVGQIWRSVLPKRYSNGSIAERTCGDGVQRRTRSSRERSSRYRLFF